mmetsp:Transcript_108294/g.233313  ORF Transcript_108294/g.233313 Transcript_108294/m.233313 type:complete len:382 (+) Transcript_108294:98-1243(+)
MADAAAAGPDFLGVTEERADLNQYWYSKDTIQAFVDEVCDCSGTAALVSSPSIYFSLPEPARGRCKVLDYDRQWEADPGFVFYDFEDPDGIPEGIRGTFDFVLVDPPFITREVWEKYAAATRMLVREGGRILCTTIAENREMMHELLGLQPPLYRPSIPNLVYQYCVYTNYESARLARLNPEIDDEDWRPSMASKPAPSEERPLVPMKRNPSAAGDASAEAGDAAPLPPAAALLSELRERVNALKKASEAVNAPLQTALRRSAAGGEAAGKAAAGLGAALDVASSAARGLADWASASAGELGAALGEEEGAFAQSLESDRLRTQAVQSMVAKARAEIPPTAASCQEIANASKLSAGVLYRLSSALLDRIKALKKEATQGGA